MESSAPPYWRLSNFYLFYFASLGALVPYWSLYLQSLGFGARAIGELMALLMVTKVISPNIWGWIADHSGRRMRVVRIGAAMAAFSFIGVFMVSGYWALGLVMFLYSFFWNAVLPQFEATTLSYLGTAHRRYSTVRLWGSIGFILSVSALGPVLQHYGPGLLPTVLMVLFLGIWGASYAVPEPGQVTHTHDDTPIWTLLRRPQVIALVVVCFLMQASHGPYYTFYTIYMRGLGYGSGLIGQLWALGVIAEVVVFLFMHRLIERFGLYTLMQTALALTTLRWVMIGLWADNLPAMLFAQTLHAASFGVFHATAIALFHHHFHGRHHGKGQALYSSVSFGGGGALGALLSGQAWASLGSTITFEAAAVASALGIVIMAVGYHRHASIGR